MNRPLSRADDPALVLAALDDLATVEGTLAPTIGFRERRA
jgi:hypothetical protein